MVDKPIEGGTGASSVARSETWKMNVRVKPHGGSCHPRARENQWKRPVRHLEATPAAVEKPIEVRSTTPMNSEQFSALGTAHLG